MELTRRRGPLQHVSDILKNARRPIKKTRLVYAANIGHVIIRRYLPLLVERGLVEEAPYITERGRRISQRTPYLYVITEEGEALLKLIEQVYIILGWDGEKPKEEKGEKPKKLPPPTPVAEQEYVEPCLYGLDFPFQDLEICSDCEHYRGQYTPVRCKWPGWKEIGWEEEQ